MSQVAFAQKIGWSCARLNELIRGKRGVTAAALDLAETLGTSPKLWLNLQATHDLAKAVEARRVRWGKSLVLGQRVEPVEVALSSIRKL